MMSTRQQRAGGAPWIWALSIQQPGDAHLINSPRWLPAPEMDHGLEGECCLFCSGQMSSPAEQSRAGSRLQEGENIQSPRICRLANVISFLFYFFL